MIQECKKLINSLNLMEKINKSNFREIDDRYLSNPMFGKEEVLNDMDTRELLSVVKEEFEVKMDERLKRVAADQIFVYDSLGNTKRDRSFYTGSGGDLYLYWRYYLLCANTKVMELDKVNSALELLKTCYNAQIHNLKEDNEISFFIGNIGIFSIGCILANITKDAELFKSNLKSILRITKEITESEQDNTDDEILYGKAGLLYSLLLICKECKNFSFDIKTQISSIFVKLINEGLKANQKHNDNPVLVYSFPKGRSRKSYYLGAAHGLSGVLYILLKTMEMFEEDLAKQIDLDYAKALIRNSLDFLLSQRFSSGNIASSIGSKHDDLVQFCHGATGTIFCFIEAEKFFQTNDYAKPIKEQADVIWQRGLLLKGFGLCHGTSGSSYALNAVFKHFKDELYLKKALYLLSLGFNEEVLNILANFKVEGRKVRGKPDRPDSLMEGDGGFLTVLCDLLNNPYEALFPGFELN